MDAESLRASREAAKRVAASRKLQSPSHQKIYVESEENYADEKLKFDIFIEQAQREHEEKVASIVPCSDYSRRVEGHRSPPPDPNEDCVLEVSPAKPKVQTSAPPSVEKVLPAIRHSTAPIPLPAKQTTTDITVRGLSMDKNRPSSKHPSRSGKSKSRQSGSRKSQKTERLKGRNPENDAVTPWTDNDTGSMDMMSSWQISSNPEASGFSISIGFEQTKWEVNESDLAVTVSMGEGNSYNVRVSTSDMDFEKPKTGSKPRVMSHSKTTLSLNHRSMSPSNFASFLTGGTSSPTNKSSRGHSRAWTGSSGRVSPSVGSRVRTRSPAHRKTPGSPNSRMSNSHYTRTPCSRNSSQRVMSEELRTLKAMNRLKHVLKSKQSAKRELLTTQLEFREIFDLRDKIATPLPPIEKPIYNCDIPSFLSPNTHPSHPRFISFNSQTNANPIESTAAELSHQRLDKYFWVKESPESSSVGAENQFEEFDRLKAERLEHKAFYYPHYFQDKDDLLKKKRGELAQLSFQQHLELDTNMQELKILLKDIKTRKLKRPKPKKWESHRSSWLMKT